MMKSMPRRLHWPAMILIFLFAAGAATAVGLPGGSPANAGYTNTDVILLISYILLALIFSFLCSVAEAVLLSITPSYIAGLRDKNPKLAALLKRLKQDNVDQSLDAEPTVTFSRLPLYQTDLDHITGFILKDDLLLSKAQGRSDVKLETLKREIKTVPGNISLSNLLEFLLDKRQQIALVSDEYGGTKGLVTTEDVVETLLGIEIVDEMDKVEDMQALARQHWAKRARALGLEVNANGQTLAVKRSEGISEIKRTSKNRI
jgi:CBS domain containing-hemolysin-like protein